MTNYDKSAQVGQEYILNFLKERMEEKKMTNYKLGQITGISRELIGKYWAGEVNPSLLNLLKICGALEIRPYFIPTEIDNNEIVKMYFN